MTASAPVARLAGPDRAGHGRRRERFTAEDVDGLLRGERRPVRVSKLADRVAE